MELVRTTPIKDAPEKETLTLSNPAILFQWSHFTKFAKKTAKDMGIEIEHDKPRLGAKKWSITFNSSTDCDLFISAIEPHQKMLVLEGLRLEFNAALNRCSNNRIYKDNLSPSERRMRSIKSQVKQTGLSVEDIKTIVKPEYLMD